MDMLKHKSIIEEGDLVIVYLDPRRLYAITMKKDEVFQSKYGALKHNDVIGQKFGSCINCTRGWVYVLFPTPEMWTVTLPHRTQIIYSADISLIIMQLDLKPGSVVCEAGTGSGSLSHSLIRTISPGGHLHTFDFHENRVELAQKEFAAHGLSEHVTVAKRDVCNEGFGIDHLADAVVLDLPNPWAVVENLFKALKLSGGRVCSFSPCIEQVQRTCYAFKNCGFVSIDTVECLPRTFEVKKIIQTVANFQNPNECDDKESDDQETTEMSDSVEMQTTSKSRPSARKDVKEYETVNHWTAMPPIQTPGHTGYLTFASLIPNV